MLTEIIAPDISAGQRKTAAARRARRRAAEQRLAQQLRDRGWTCIAPDDDNEGKSGDAR